MSSSTCYQIALLFICAPRIFGELIHINQSHATLNTEVHCNGSESCTIFCDAEEACQQSILYCPQFADCNITCKGFQSCELATIIWSPDTTINSTLTCEGGEACLAATKPPIYAPDDNKPFTLICTEANCWGALIRCPSNAECHIECDWAGCGKTSIIWPSDYKYTLTCNQHQHSCHDIVYKPYANNQPLVIHATTTRMLSKSIIHCPQNAWCNITCEGIHVCDGSTIHCALCHLICKGGSACLQAVFTGTGTLSICNGEDACEDTVFPKPPATDKYILHCYGDYSCRNAFIQCPDRAECHIFCHSFRSCYYSFIKWPANSTINATIYCNQSVSQSCYKVNMPYTVDIFPSAPSDDFYYTCSEQTPCNETIIHCPSDAGCFITCEGPFSCNGVSVNWTEEQKHSLQCSSAEGSCRGGSIMPANDDMDYTLRCDENYMCSYATIHCPQNASCAIVCRETDSCKHATIYGPIDYPLTVDCEGDLSTNTADNCESAFIYAQNASFFTLRGCHTWGSCRYLSIWFPPRLDSASAPRSIIYASVIHNYVLNDVHFYAINGWTDVAIDFTIDDRYTIYTSEVIVDLYGKMHCGLDYEIICTLIPTEWRCNPYGISICNEYYLPSIISTTEMITTGAYISDTEITDQSVTETHILSTYLGILSTSVQTERDFLYTLDTWIIVAVAAGIVIILCIFLCFCIKKIRCGIQKNLHDVISNGLAVIIVIGEYDEHVAGADFDGFLDSLPLENDIKNLKNVFRLLNYKVIPKNIEKLHWKESELIDFLKRDIGNELFDEEGELKYDGLVVCISAHGLKNNIITSDYMTIEKAVFHRIISIKYPKVREIPRIFLFDSCEGSLERQKTEMLRPSSLNEEEYKMDVLPQNETKEEEEKNSRDFMIEREDKSKGISLEHIHAGGQWTTSTKNPDYKLVEIHAANTGFQSKCHKEFGSYLIYLFAKKMTRNIIDEKGETLGAIFDEIQNELHDSGKSLPKNVFNNTTAKLMFRVNPKSIRHTEYI